MKRIALEGKLPLLSFMLAYDTQKIIRDGCPKQGLADAVVFEEVGDARENSDEFLGLMINMR